MNTSDSSPPQRLGRTYQESETFFPEPESPDGPNVVLIMFDDLGFADLGCYGSEIRTPNIDAIASEGHRYNNFHTTTLCSPSRACLLTGRNHHSVGMRMLASVDSGWPSGRGRIARNAGLVSEILQEAGYDTFAVGKWHLAPMYEASGPYEEWPLGRGFNQFYGFLNGSADQFYPELVRDNHTVDPPASPEEGYHITDDLIDRANHYIADNVAFRPDDPFFLYVPLGAAHSPHHAPKEFMEAVRGRYDVGWDEIRQRRYERQLAEGIIPEGTVLPPSNPDVPRWESLSEEERVVSVRLQEAYAAFIEHSDHALGRLFEQLRRTGQWDNTIIILLSDNGAAFEGGRFGAFTRINFFNGLDDDIQPILESLDEIGGPRADNHYPTGWAQASNTPLRWYKYHTHGGGIRDPLIVSWPGHLAKPGAVLDQFHHIIDLMPTVLELSGVDAPEEIGGVPQMPVHGSSLAYTFQDPGAKTVRDRQYFEMFGNRGIWSNGWKAVAKHDKGADYDAESWELYHLDEDFSESNDLAETYPEKLRELVDMWWVEAGKHDVLPLDDRSVELFAAPPPPSDPTTRSRFDYFPPISHIERAVAPPFEHAKRHRIEVDVSGPMSGVIMANGNVSSGFSFYMEDGELVYEYSAPGKVTTLRAKLPDTDRLMVSFWFELGAERTGRGRLQVGEEFGEWVDFDRWLSFLAMAGVDIGADELSPVSDSYEAPFAFTGTIHRVTVHVDNDGEAVEPTVLDD